MSDYGGGEVIVLNKLDGAKQELLDLSCFVWCKHCNQTENVKLK